MNIFVYQRGKTTGPFTAEGLRQRLLSGELKPTHLVWHSRLIEWVPLGALASTPHREDECADMPAPQASPHYIPSGSSSAPERPRQRVRRSRGEENDGSSDSASSRSASVSQPQPDRERRKSRSGMRRSSSAQGEASASSISSNGDPVRKQRTKREAKKEPKKTSNISLWTLVKDFFRH